MLEKGKKNWGFFYVVSVLVLVIVLATSRGLTLPLNVVHICFPLVYLNKNLHMVFVKNKNKISHRFPETIFYLWFHIKLWQQEAEKMIKKGKKISLWLDQKSL